MCDIEPNEPASAIFQAPVELWTMTKVEKLEREVRNLSAKQLTSFREWFAAFDAAKWDRQIEDDVQAGKLDRLADEALSEHHAGRSRKL